MLSLKHAWPRWVFYLLHVGEWVCAWPSPVVATPQAGAPTCTYVLQSKARWPWNGCGQGWNGMTTAFSNNSGKKTHQHIKNKQTSYIKSTYHDLNLVPHPFKPCVLTTRLTHATQKSLAPSPSQSCSGSLPGRASLTYCSDTPLQ